MPVWYETKEMLETAWFTEGTVEENKHSDHKKLSWKAQVFI